MKGLLNRESNTDKQDGQKYRLKGKQSDWCIDWFTYKSTDYFLKIRKNW